MRFRDYPVRLVAEKVETQEEFEFCRDLGFEYFQGYFLCRPKILTGRRVQDNRPTLLRLLAALPDPELPPAELETLIRHDVSLGYKLLRYINSAFFGLPKKVESIGQAIVYLGNRSVKTWASRLLLSGVDDKPHELMTTAMVRAKMCELMANRKGLCDEDVYFTAGLFSVLDAIARRLVNEASGIESVLPACPWTKSAMRTWRRSTGSMRLTVTLAEQQPD